MSQDDYRESPEIQNLTDKGFDVENVSELLDGIKEYGLILPKKDIQFPIIKHYLLAPSQLCSVLGVLFSQGVSGSGKSDITKIAAAIHGLTDSEAIVMAESSPASIRNKICSLKYGSDWMDHLENGGALEAIEQNCILLWDDIKPSHLKIPFILSLIKSSYNRKSAIVEIAIAGEGKNQSFNVFSKKVTSSIHPIWQETELVELKRRVFPIKHVPYSAMSDEDKACNLTPDSEDLILWEYVDFSSYRGFSKFWDTDRLEAFSNLSKDRKVRNVIRKASIDPKFIQLSHDVIISGMVADDLSVGDCVDLYETYWDFVNAEILSKKSTTETFLTDFIRDKETEWNNHPMTGQYPCEIGSDDLQTALNKASIRGELIGNWRTNLKEAMGMLGYEQDKSDHEPRIVWKRTY